MVPDGMKVLFQGKAAMLREIAQLLADAGVPVRTGPLPGAWDPRIWLAVAGPDVERALALHRAHLEEMVRKEGLPVRDAVVDLDAEETQCPACQTTFRTAGVTRCPDCGLAFA